MSIEAMKLALEALDGWRKGFPDHWGDIDKYAVDSLRQSIEQAQKQECYCGNITRLGVVHRADTFCDEHPEQAQKQEPVEWGVDWGKAGDIPCVSIIKRLPDGGIEVLACEYAPYSYTSPPQRQWVGLTDEERQMHIRYASTLEDIALSIEVKLKEKNSAS